MKNSENTISFPLYNQLLIAATQATLDISVFSDILHKTEDKGHWTKLTKMAYHHAVIPQLYKTDRDFANLLPVKQTIFLEEENRRITFENMKLSAELIKLTKILDERQFPYISIKGPALSQELYHDITVRQICDLDILVDEADVIVIAQLLLDLGYKSTLPMSLLENEGFRALDNDFTLLQPEKKIMVELHWKLFPNRHKMALDFNTLYQDVKQVTIQKHPITVLSTEHDLLYLCLHASKHIFEQLKWVCDIDRLVRNNPHLDLEAIYMAAEKLTVQTPFILALLMSQRLYDTPISAAVTDKTTPHTDALLDEALQYFKDDFTTLDEPTKKRIRFLFLQKLNNDKQNRFASLFMAVFKPSSVDYIHYQLPKSLNFLYPVLRPPRLIYKYALKRLGL